MYFFDFNHSSCSFSRFWLVLSFFGIGHTLAVYDYVLLSLHTFRWLLNLSLRMVLMLPNFRELLDGWYYYLLFKRFYLHLLFLSFPSVSLHSDYLCFTACTFLFLGLSTVFFVFWFLFIRISFCPLPLSRHLLRLSSRVRFLIRPSFLVFAFHLFLNNWKL